MAPPLYYCPPECLVHDPGAGHPERPARITAIAEALAARGGLGYERRTAPAASREQLERVHAPAYVERVRTLDAGTLAEDTVVGPGSYDAATHAAGAACAMAEALLAGEGRVGFCAVRPPGHHAAADTTSGFCLFNSVAVAARHALAELGVRRVMVVDWDVHHGDGTHDIFRDSAEVLFEHPPGRAVPRHGGAERRRRARGRGLRDQPAGARRLRRGHLRVPARAHRRPRGRGVPPRPRAHLGGLRRPPRRPAGRLPARDVLLRGARAAGARARRARRRPGRRRARGRLRARGARRLGGRDDGGLAGDEPPDMVAPDFVTSRAASHIGHHWTL